MSGAAIMRDARVKAAAMVSTEEARTGSRMVAYENVGQMVGATGEWIRHFVKGYRGVPNFIVGYNIIEQYSRLCERVENNANNRREQADALLRQFHAADPGTSELVAGISPAQADPEVDRGE